MSKKPVFYSFHYDNDVFRVQQIRNIGILEGNTPANANDWETIKKKGDKAVEEWIDDNMAYKQCVIVLIGSDTANRPWVLYEIEKAWKESRPIFGIYIHNIKSIDGCKSSKGKNPFELIDINGKKLSLYINCYEPNEYNAYNDIAKNIGGWIDKAILQRK